MNSKRLSSVAHGTSRSVWYAHAQDQAAASTTDLHKSSVAGNEERIEVFQ